jgi:hypothetical protein
MNTFIKLFGITVISLALVAGSVLVSKAQDVPLDLERLEKLLRLVDFLEPDEPALGAFGTTGGGSVAAPTITRLDLAGTGTTTGADNFGGPEYGTIATTTTIFPFGDSFSRLNLNVFAALASSTGSHINVSLLKSDAPNCEETSAAHGDMGWVDLLATQTTTNNSRSYDVATTEYNWNPTISETGIDILLTDVTAKCIKSYVGGASTTVWVTANRH